MKIYTISDLHGNLPKTESHDILIIAGDVFPGASLDDDLLWARKELYPWLKSQRLVIFIKGNHDYNIWKYEELFSFLPWTILNDKLLEINGLKIYGSGWTSPVGLKITDSLRSWWGGLANEEQLSFIWKNIPENLDILVTHSPPYSIMDKNIDGELLGSPSLLKEIRVKKPIYHIYGHAHMQKETRISLYDTEFINAAISTNENKLFRPGQLIKL